MSRSSIRPSFLAFSASLALLLGTLPACIPTAGEATGEPVGSGGSQASASGGGGGMPSSGGSATGGSATGGSPVTATGGAPGSGGGGGSSSPGTGGGGNGTATGGSLGSNDASGNSDTPATPPVAGGPAKPSAGCGKANPPTGARTLVTGGKTGNFIVTLPAGYDAQQPLPMGFAFHGYGLNEKTCAGGSECPGFKDLKAITVYVKSIGAGWEYPIPLLQPNITFFTDLVALMKAEYCVDESRIFVAGVSSGGQFVEHLSCRFGDWLWQVSPIAAYVDKGVDVDCKGTPAQLIIHGITDNLEKNAHAVRDLFAKRNGCPTVPAGMADAEAKMKAARAATRAEVACLDYEGCTKAPLRYCVFSQVTYNGLTHGWPKVGGQLIGEFQSTLK